jgi:PAS domain S-box-containing protein
MSMVENSTQTEQHLIGNQKRYKGLFNHSIDGICLHEIVYENDSPVDYRILDLNPKYEEITGIKGGDAVGLLASEVYKTPDAPYLEVYASVAGTGKPTTFETYFPPLDKHFLISAFSLEAGQFATIFRDITEQKAIEKALAESEHRYRTLFHNHLSVMFIIDSGNGRILDANKAAVAYYGWSYKEMTSKRISDINTLSEAQVRAEMDSARKELRNIFNFRHRRADGSIRDVEVYSTPITIQNRQLLYSIVHDVTDRKRADEERTRLIGELQDALGEIKTLQGILPICVNCKKIRDDKGYWNRLEAYLYDHSDVQLSHGICPDCMKKLYPKYADDEEGESRATGDE